MLEAFLLGLVAFIAQCEYALGTCLISRPIVTGTLTGLILGDIKMGIIMGATLELAFIGSFSVGASIPPDPVTGGILGVAFAIKSGQGVETALLLALPIATFTLILKNLYLGLIIPIFNHKADEYANDGNIKGIELMHLLSGFALSLLLGIIVFVSILVGSSTISYLVSSIPEFIKHGLVVATGLIPALGFAMLARLLLNKKLLSFFFLGFLISAYLNIPLTGIALFGTIIAIITTNLEYGLINKIEEKEQDDEDF